MNKKICHTSCKNRKCFNKLDIISKISCKVHHKIVFLQLNTNFKLKTAFNKQVSKKLVLQILIVKKYLKTVLW